MIKVIDVAYPILQVPSLNKQEAFLKDFGLIIFDEAHHAPSKYFSRALPIISCKKSFLPLGDLRFNVIDFLPAFCARKEIPINFLLSLSSAPS